MKDKVKTLKVAFVHDWLVTWRGGEKVLEALLSLYPDAPIYTLFYDATKMPDSIRKRNVIVHAGANYWRFARKALLPLMPLWIESLPLEQYDLVISTSSCVAKGVLLAPHAKHLCYIHSPMRYIWDQRDEYLGRARKIPFVGLMIEALSVLLRMWDVSSAHRVSLFVANSNFVRQRVKKYYGKDATVIHPPIDVNRFLAHGEPPKKGGYYLVAGAFVGYKKFDLAIAACQKMARKLIVAGDGPAEASLRHLGGSKTEFVVAPDAKRWQDLLRGADALIFPGVEDFGMVAIEAMACGTPVIAFRAGGALDFICEGSTGLFFDEPTVDSLCDALRRSDEAAWSIGELQTFARRFETEKFIEQIREKLAALLEQT